MKYMIIPTLAILILTAPQITHAAEGATMSHSTPKGANYAKGANKGSAMKYSKPAHIPIARPTTARKAPALTAKDSEVETNAADKIWEKYRALAGGQDTAAPKAATIPVKKVKKAKIKTQEQPATATGIAGIISQYQANKQKRSQMRSLTIAKPAIEKEGDKKAETAEEE